MESKWYFFPGQTPSNTKISDRAHALHITSSSWNQITKHLDRKRLIQEALDKEKAHKKALKDGSEAMTKQWPNSIENLRIKKEQLRLEEIEREKREKIENFYRLKAEHEAERTKFINKMKKQIFTSSGYAKSLTSALLLSETLYEREKQLEFNAKLKDHDKEVELAYYEKIVRDAEAEKAEKAEQKRAKLERDRAYGKILKQQVEENEALLKSYQTKRAQKEAVDYANAEAEQKLIQQIEHEEKLRKRREMLQDQRKQIQLEKQRQKVMQDEERELEHAVELYANAKRRIDCMMKKNEKEMREEEIRKREELTAKVAAIQEEKDAGENERIAVAIAESDAKEQAKQQAKEAALEKAKLDRIQDRKDYLERKAKDAKLESELQKWEMLNRIKTNEAIAEHNIKMAADLHENKKKYGRQLKEQMAEEAEFRKEEKRIEDIMDTLDYSENDKMFFEYAGEVRDLAKSKNRSTYPIECVVDAYKRENGMVKKNAHSRCCQK